MSLPSINPIDPIAWADSGLYNEDEANRDDFRANNNLTDVTLSRESFVEAVDVLNRLGFTFVSTGALSDTNTFIDVFNAYQAYMNS